MRTVVLPVLGYLILAACVAAAVANLRHHRRTGRWHTRWMAAVVALAVVNLAVWAVADVGTGLRAANMALGVALAGFALTVWLGRR